MNAAPNDNPSILPPAAVCALIAFVLHLAPDGRTLAGWDEWILAEIIGRTARIAPANGDLYGMLVPTSYPYPPIFFWLSSIGVGVFGPQAWAYRIGTALGAALCAGATAAIGVRVGGRWCGWFAGALVGISFGLSYYDTISIDPLMTGFIVLGIYVFVQSVNEKRGGLACAAVLCTGLACAVKYHAVVMHAVMCAAVLVVLLRSGSFRTVWDRYVLAALIGPVFVLSLEALTAHLYGWNKTHIAEAMRMTQWPAYTLDPMSGQLVEPGISFYPVTLFLKFGVMQSLLAIVGFFAFITRGGSLRWIALFIIAWMAWAQWMEMKHARYLLPGVCLLFVCMGYVVASLARHRIGWHFAFVITIVAIGGSAWIAQSRIDDYHARIDRMMHIIETVEVHVPEGDVVVSDARTLQGTTTTRLRHIDRRVGTPFGLKAMETNFLLTEEAGYQSFKVGAMRGGKKYIAFRDEAIASWDVLLDVGTGMDRVRLLRRTE